MALKKHLKGLKRKERIDTAKKAGISHEYLRLVANGHKTASLEVAESLEAVTGVPGAAELVSASNKKLLQRLRANGSAA